MAAERGSAAAKPIWMKQAEEARLKSEAEKAAAAKAAFEATFKALEAAKDAAGQSPSSSSDDEDEDLARKPVGPPDPSKCLAAGPGIAGGAACSPSSFVVTAKDADGRRVPHGGANVCVRVSPGVGVGGGDLDGLVKDNGDGTYAVTYAVSKRGNYMVHVELESRPIAGSPFPVFFSTGPPAASANAAAAIPSSHYPSMLNQTMPNMPNYTGAVSGAFPGLLGMIPAAASAGALGGVVLPGIGASLGEICREYLAGRCAKADCKFGHPAHNLLMMALTATTTMGTLSHAPMAPSAAAMAAAQAIMAAQALQAHAAAQQARSKEEPSASGVPDKSGKVDALKKTLQVSNLSPLLTADHLKQLFGYCGTVVDCTITDSKHFAYIEYSKPEEAAAALALNNMDVGGRPMNVEMAKTLPSKSASSHLSSNASSIPLMMQQAVAMQQMNFQQALLMQQTLASQQAANRAATMKSATEMASARAAEISKKLKGDGLADDDKEVEKKSRSPSPLRQRSKSRSRSPIKYRRSRRSRSFSPPPRFSRDQRSRSPVRSHHHGSERRSYKERDVRDSFSKGGRRERERSRDHYSSSSRRYRSRSASPRSKRSSRAGSSSPKHHRRSPSPRTKKSSGSSSRLSRHHGGSGSSPRSSRDTSSRRSRQSRSRSAEGRHYSNHGEDRKSEKLKVDQSKHDGSSKASKDGRDLRDSKKEKTQDSSEAKHKRSSLPPEDETLEDDRGRSKHKKSRLETSSHQRRHFKSGSGEREHHSSHKEGKKSEKAILDCKKSEASNKASKDVKDSKDSKEDMMVDLSETRHKKRSLAPENLISDEDGEDRTVGYSEDHKESFLPTKDGTLEDNECITEHEKSLSDDLSTGKVDIVMEDQLPMRELSDDKKYMTDEINFLFIDGFKAVQDQSILDLSKSEDGLEGSC